ncbi:MAG: DUF1573 domain-containing protein [bacterium]|nr:DUF1573 domain-containing protein [bacterium]
MKYLLIPVSAAFLLFSCGGSEEVEGATAQSGEIKSAIDASEELSPEAKKQLAEERKRIAEEEKKLEATLTSMTFDKEMHDFGDVEAETDVTTQFTVTNTGKRPLVIENVSASCGCTTPKKPEKPIAPGASDVIEVKFKSKPGQMNEITKTVTVTANTKEKTHQLKIRAFVKG